MTDRRRWERYAWAPALVTLTCLQDREDSRPVIAAFRALQEQRGRLPRAPLVVLYDLPPASFSSGMGVAEMVRLALDDPAAEGVLEGQKMPEAWIRRLNRMPAAYVLDCRRIPPALRRLRRDRVADAGPALAGKTAAAR